MIWIAALLLVWKEYTLKLLKFKQKLDFLYRFNYN